jgi:hypothetical protein
MAETLYVNKPGGVIAHQTDGTSVNLKYGDRVPVDDLADYVDPKTFADGKQRVAVDAAEADAHRRAAIEAEAGQVNSSSSPVPSNYSELDEDAAAQFVEQLAAYPGQQSEVVRHEILFGGNRQKVIDAAGEYAKHAASARIDAAGDERTDLADIDADADREDLGGDPLQGTDREAVAERIQERAAASVGKKQKTRSRSRSRSQTPPPSGSDAEEGEGTGEGEGDESSS